MLGKAFPLLPPFAILAWPFNLRNALNVATHYRRMAVYGNKYQYAENLEFCEKRQGADKLYPKVKVYISNPLPLTSITS